MAKLRADDSLSCRDKCGTARAEGEKRGEAMEECRDCEESESLW